MKKNFNYLISTLELKEDICTNFCWHKLSQIPFGKDIWACCQGMPKGRSWCCEGMQSSHRGYHEKGKLKRKQTWAIFNPPSWFLVGFWRETNPSVAHPRSGIRSQPTREGVAASNEKKHKVEKEKHVQVFGISFIFPPMWQGSHFGREWLMLSLFVA